MTAKSQASSPRAKAMTAKAAARIQSRTAKANGGVVPKGSFAARAQRAAAKSPKR